MPAPIDISCDESGNNGENLVDSSTRVFALGSHDLENAESAEVMDWLRAESGVKAPELKAKYLFKIDPDIVVELFAERLAGHGYVYLTETDYFAVSKVIDLLVEELTHSSGVDLYAGGQARALAQKFYAEGSRAVGRELWKRLLSSFNSLMRVNAGSSGVPKATVEEFFELAAEALSASKRRNVTQALELVARSREFADEFQNNLGDQVLPALEPLFPAVAQTARHWYDVKGAEIRICHDDAPSLRKEGVIEALLENLRDPGPFKKYVRPIAVADLVLLDSSSDPRVQVADLIAGFSARIASGLLTGDRYPGFLDLLRPMVGKFALWGDDATFRELTGSRLR